MTLKSIICAVRGHKFSRWRSLPSKQQRGRRCKRCDKFEVGPALVKVQTGGEGGV